MIRQIEDAAAAFQRDTGRPPARVGLTGSQRVKLAIELARLNGGPRMKWPRMRCLPGDTVAGMVICDASAPGPHTRG